MHGTHIFEGAKSRLKRLASVRAAWTVYRSRQLKARYRGRRGHYEQAARDAGLSYRREDVVAAIRRRLGERGWRPSAKPARQVHTFAFIPRLDWHAHLLPDLEALGPLSHFDYTRLGYGIEEFRGGGAPAHGRRDRMNRVAIDALREAHARQPVDWIFVYASGVEISRGMVEEMTAATGIPTVNMCLDDKQSWQGQMGICPAFDISWTSARVACEWYLAEDARPIYMPEGCDIATYRTYTESAEMDVSFIGAAYGFRARLIERLRDDGVAVRCFGPGWPAGPVRGEAAARVMSRSRINLGMGGIGYAEDLMNVKTRDFEVPAVGGGVYLTSFNPDLAQHFHVGREILCYRTYDDLLEQIRYYLGHPDEAQAIAVAGQRRARAEHRWLDRYMELLRILEVLR